MTNLMTKLKTGIAIGALVVGTMVGATSAQAIDFQATIRGYDFNNPWSADLTGTGMTYAQHAQVFNDDPVWTFATLAIIDEAMTAAGITAGDYDAFMFALGFSANDDVEGPGCTGSYCDVRLDTIETAGVHKALFETNIYGPDNVDDESIGDMNIIIGALGYKIHAAPSPEVTGLMLGGLGLMGFAALRRK